MLVRQKHFQRNEARFAECNISYYINPTAYLLFGAVYLIITYFTMAYIDHIKTK